MPLDVVTLQQATAKAKALVATFLTSSSASGSPVTTLTVNLVVQPVSIQTLAANGAVTLDASLGDAMVILEANATSSTITNPTDRQILRVTWEQDAVGNRAYAWPSNCKFAGGAAPSDTTANARTTVTFRYESGSSAWFELDRAVAVH